MDHIEERIIDDPGTTFAQFLHEVQEGKLDAGVRRASVNMVTLIGGFVRFYGTEAQRRACAIYRQLWETSQVGGARAVDPSREPVDGGWTNPEAVFINGAEARIRYRELTTHLGLNDTNRLHFVVVGEWGPTSFAKHFYHVRTPNNRHVADAKVEVRKIADKAAAFLDLTGVGGATKMNRWGAKPTEIETKGEAA